MACDADWPGLLVSGMEATTAPASTMATAPTTPTPATTTTAKMMMMRLIRAYHVHGRLEDASQVYTNLEIGISTKNCKVYVD